MTVRPFDWRDLATLHRLRHNSIFLDSELVLTRGPMLVPGALLSYLAPAMGIFTAVSETDEGDDPISGGAGSPLIGQVIHLYGSQFAHLTFVTPDGAFDSPALPELFEYLIVTAGERGAFRMLADVDERTMAFDALRRTGFVIYARQRIWQLTSFPRGRSGLGRWRGATSKDASAIRSLYNNLLPGLVHQVEPFLTNKPRGMVYYDGDELLAYVEIKYGPNGIWAQPFVHPDAEHVSEWFIELLQNLPSRRARPVYICVRSYQSWLQAAIEEMGAETGPRQAVMVKHLTNSIKAARAYAMPVLDSTGLMEGQPGEMATFESTPAITRFEHDLVGE